MMQEDFDLVAQTKRKSSRPCGWYFPKISGNELKALILTARLCGAFGFLSW